MLPLETHPSTLHGQCLCSAGLGGENFHIHRTEEADSHVTCGLSGL